MINDILEYLPLGFILLSFFIHLVIYKSISISILYFVSTITILLIGIIIRYFMDIEVRELYRTEDFSKFILEVFNKIANRYPFHYDI